MAIYARFGETVKVLRYATPEDVREMDPPYDGEAERNLAKKSWVVVQFEEGHEMISALAFLTADGGSKEIMDAVRATEKAEV